MSDAFMYYCGIMIALLFIVDAVITLDNERIEREVLFDEIEDLLFDANIENAELRNKLTRYETYVESNGLRGLDE